MNNVAWGSNVNLIFIRDSNSQPPMNNMLIGVITLTLSSYPPEVRPGATSGLQRTCLNAIWTFRATHSAWRCIYIYNHIVIVYNIYIYHIIILLYIYIHINTCILLVHILLQISPNRSPHRQSPCVRWDLCQSPNRRSPTSPPALQRHPHGTTPHGHQLCAWLPHSWKRRPWRSWSGPQCKMAWFYTLTPGNEEKQSELKFYSYGRPFISYNWL